MAKSKAYTKPVPVKVLAHAYAEKYNVTDDNGNVSSLKAGKIIRAAIRSARNDSPEGFTKVFPDGAEHQKGARWPDVPPKVANAIMKRELKKLVS